MDVKKFSRAALYVAIAIALAWVGFRFLLPILLPFFIGFLLSRAAEPIIRALQKNKTLPRWVCSAASMVLIYVVLGVVLFFLFRSLLQELQGFVSQLPQLLSSLAGPMQALEGWLSRMAAKLPDGIGATASQWVENLFQSGSVLVESLYGWLMRLVSRTVSSLPGTMLFLVTAILSSFMFSSQWPTLRRSILKRLPKTWAQHIDTFTQRIKSAMGGWCKAQLKLMGVCFVVVTVGLWILGADFPLLFGGLIAVVDALPVLGTGTVLIPWAIISFLQGNGALGFGLLILYAVASLTRTALEPRLLGRQIGLSPLVTLFAMYAGYRLMGIAGMILFPICAILAKQFVELWEIQKN